MSHAYALSPDERVAYSIYKVMAVIGVILFLASLFFLIYSKFISQRRATVLKGYMGFVLSVILLLISRVFLRLFAPHALADTSSMSKNVFFMTLAGIVFVAILLLIGWMVVVRIKTARASKPREKTPPHTHKTVSMKLCTPFLAYLGRESFQMESDTTYLSTSAFSWHATYEIKEWQHVLTFYQQDLSVCTLVYHKQEEVVDVVVPKGLTLTDVPEDLASVGLSIHRHLYEQYLSQHFSIHKWHEVYVSSISSRNVQEAVSSLLTLHYKVLSYHNQFSSETLIFLNELFPEDVKQLLHPYLRLPVSQQQQMESSLLDKLSLLHKRLASYEEDLNTQLEKDMEYAFRLIDEKYQTRKDNEV